MTSANPADNLDLAGGSFPGVPGALVGRGMHVGWGVTVVGYDVTDLYLETVDPTCGGTIATPGSAPACVAFSADGNPAHATLVQMTKYHYNLFGNSNGVDVYVVPHHGPMIQYAGGAATTGVSMRWTGHEATNDFAGFFGLNTATSVGSPGDAANSGTAFGALRNYSVGAQNFVLADDAGHIGYDPHALVPLRPWAGVVVQLPIGPGGSLVPVPLDPWIPLPGIGIAEWGPGGINCAGTGANAPPASCWTADADLPHSVNPTKGYLATANSDPGGYGDTNDPTSTNGGKYLSFDWDDPTDVRYARIATLLKAKSTAPAKVSMDDMKAIQSDHVMLAAKLFLPFLPPKASVVVSSTVTAQQVAAYDAAFDMLTQWDHNGLDCPTGLSGISPSSPQDPSAANVFNSASCLLFHIYTETLLKTVFTDDFALLGVGSDAGRQIRAMLYMLGLENASLHAGGSPTPAGTEYCRNVKNGTQDSTDCFTQEVTALITAYLTISADAGAPPTPTGGTTKWLWGKYHTLTILDPAAPLIGSGYSAGPFARPGGALTVDVGNPDGSQSTPLGQSYSHGSNVRFIGEIQAPASSTTLMQLPGLEHDQPFGLFASTPDLITPYVQNQYFNYLMNHQVDAHAVSTQGFAP
jgi:penicillin amidase